MDKRKHGVFIMAAIGTAVLIFDGKTAIAGIREGLAVCIQTLIPALFPFLFLSGLLTDSLRSIQWTPVAKLGRMCKIPDSLSSVLPIGWLGGYPMGAGCAAKLVRDGSASVRDATRIAVICNNAGPAFLFGILGSFFSQRSTVFVLWFLHLLSGILAGLRIPGDGDQVAQKPVPSDFSFVTVLNRSLHAMGSICGCVMLFRMLLEFFNRWILWLLPDAFRILTAGFLELSNGCLLLDQIPQEHYRFILASILLSFGGTCVWMQTAAVFPGIRMKLYIKGKLLQTYFSLVLSSALAALSCHEFLKAFICIGFLAIPYGIPLLGLPGRKKEVAI